MPKKEAHLPADQTQSRILQQLVSKMRALTCPFSYNLNFAQQGWKANLKAELIAGQSNLLFHYYKSRPSVLHLQFEMPFQQQQQQQNGLILERRFTVTSKLLGGISLIGLDKGFLRFLRNF